MFEFMDQTGVHLTADDALETLLSWETAHDREPGRASSYIHARKNGGPWYRMYLGFGSEYEGAQEHLSKSYAANA